MAYPIFDRTSVVDVIDTIVTNMKTVGEELYFYYGTPIETNTQRLKDKDGNVMKTPFICVFEPFDSDFVLSREDPVQETPNLWMVFMTGANYKDWMPEDYYTNAIKPMETLLLRFLNQCEKEEGLVNMTEYEDVISKTNHHQWGLTLNTKGSNTLLFNDALSGVEIKNFQLPVLKQYTCNGNI